jgi:hypothetical protein
MSDIDRMREALEDIYADARYVMDGSLADGTPIRRGDCRWCGSPPPRDDMDHDVACPAAKAGWALRLPGYADTDREPRTRLDDLWDALWEDLRHNATGRSTGLIIIAKHRPAIEAEAAALDTGAKNRLVRAIVASYGEMKGGRVRFPSDAQVRAEAADILAEYERLRGAD